MKKKWIIMMALIAISGASPLYAATVSVDFSWTGALGYTMAGTMLYDDIDEFVTVEEADTDPLTIESMVVSFFDPSSTLLGTYDQIVDFSPVYFNLTFSYDKASRTFSDYIDMGSTVLNEYYLSGTTGFDMRLNQSGGIDPLDNTPDLSQITVEAVPEPASVMMIGLSGALIAGYRRIRRAYGA
jgi:hypothetical protein